MVRVPFGLICSLAAAALAAPGLGCGGAGDRLPPDETELRAHMRAAGIPGLQAAVILDDEIAFSGAYGLADLESGRAVDERSLFIVASVSKTVVTITALRLWADGQLDLDAPIDDILGFAVRHPDHPETPITARQLLTHTSGIIDDFVTLGQFNTNGDSEVSLAEFAKSYVTPGEPRYSDTHFGEAPGTAYDYSNSGFGILGAVLEAAAQTPLPELTQRLVFDPAGMPRSTWRVEGVDPRQLATPYAGTWEDGYTALPHAGAAYYPATTLKTTALELAQYLRVVLRDLKDGSGGLLPHDVARLLDEPQVPALRDDQAMGWQYEEFTGRRYLGHTGSTTGSSAIVLTHPEDGIGLVIVTNSDAFVRGRLGAPAGQRALLDLLRQLDDWARAGL